MNTLKMRSVLIAAILVVVAVAFWSQSELKPDLNPPAAAPSQTPQIANGPTATTNPSSKHHSGHDSRPFVSLSVQERNSLFLEIKKMDLADIMQQWLAAGRVDRDPTKQGAVASAWAYAMREKKPSRELIEELRRFIMSDSNSILERSQLLGILADARTKESVELLVSAALSLSDQQLRQIAIAAVRTVGGLRGDGTFHEEVSIPLERAWRESQEESLLISVAFAMAEVGASNGISLLLNSAIYDANRDEVRARSAQAALSRATILNPSAVPPLAAVLGSSQPGSAARKLASDTLAATGIPAAGTALLEWLQNDNEDVAPLVRGYVKRTRTPAMLTLWESAVNSATPFRNEKNRDAIREGLALYNHGIKYEAPK